MFINYQNIYTCKRTKSIPKIHTIGLKSPKIPMLIK